MRMYVRTYVRTYVCMYVCMYVCVLYIYIYIYSIPQLRSRDRPADPEEGQEDVVLGAEMCVYIYLYVQHVYYTIT